MSGGVDNVVRVLLLTKTLNPGTDPIWRTAPAPWALAAFCLRSYIDSIPALAERVNIEIRSYPSDVSDALVLEEIRQRRPDIVGFTSQPWNYLDNIRISRTIARLWPDMVIVHGGPMVISRGAYLARTEGAVDIAVEGEAEETFAELMQHFAFDDRSLETIDGIAFLDDRGEVRATPPRDPPDLSKLPPIMSAKNLADMGSYVLYETARGCPFRCSFCNWGSQRTKLRSRNRAAIEHDLAAILATRGVEQIWLTDSGLDISIDHVTFVADTIVRHRTTKVGVCGYAFLLHADLSYVARIRKGIDQLLIGLQTANEDTLSEMGRKALSVKRFDRILDAVLPHYPSLRVDLLFGLPTIGPAELRDSVRFLLGKGLWYFNLFRLVAIPGTELAENKEKYGLVADEDDPFTVYASDGCTSEDMFEMQQFKVNMDALRFVAGHGGYARALEAGIDLVDFASKLHELVPNLNRLVPYGVDYDWVPSADVVALMIEAVDRYTDDEEGRRMLQTLMRSRVESAEANATRRLLAEEPTEVAIEKSEQREAEPRVEPDVAVSNSTEHVELRMSVDGGSWTLRIEPAAADRRYFRLVGRNGLYYESDQTAGGDRRAAAVLEVLTKRLIDMVNAGVVLDHPDQVAACLQAMKIRGLEIARASTAAQGA